MAKEKKSRKLYNVYAAIEEQFPSHLAACRAFLRQKSVSVTGEGIPETADIVKTFIEEIGGEASLWGDPQYPVVFGRYDRGFPKTLIIYGMYDVQPAEEPDWITPPFEAALCPLVGLGDCIIARGAVNSKGALCGLFNVLKTMAERDVIPLNLVFAIEGEEEIGSPQFESFIHAHRPWMKGEGVVDFDFSQDTTGNVSMHLGLKGIVYMDLVCRGGKKGGPTTTTVHGSASAWIASPVWRLIQALSLLTDRKENITIPGFYDNVVGPDKSDLALLKKLEKVFNAKVFLKEMKSLCFKYNRQGIDLLKKGLYSPIINVNGFHAGYGGSGTKTVLPRKATAKIDIRFGPFMEPDEVVSKFTRYLSEKGFDDIEVNVRDSYTWSKTHVSAPLVQQMIRAYQQHKVSPEVWPIATWAAPYFVFSRILRLPVVSGGMGHGGRQHAANEYMTVAGLKEFEKFVATFLYHVADNTA